MNRTRPASDDLLPRFALDDYVRAGSYVDLPNTPPIDATTLEGRVDAVEGEGPRILIRDFGPWSIEFVFDAADQFTADQVRFHPEGVDLDPDDDPRAVRALCGFAWWASIASAGDVAGVVIEAVYGTGLPEDEVVVLLGNGVNLHYQPAGSGHVLRLVRSRHGSARDRALIRRVHPRLRPA